MRRLDPPFKLTYKQLQNIAEGSLPRFREGFRINMGVTYYFLLDQYGGIEVCCYEGGKYKQTEAFLASCCKHTFFYNVVPYMKKRGWFS
jgi:hypothetical protein